MFFHLLNNYSIKKYKLNPIQNNILKIPSNDFMYSIKVSNGIILENGSILDKENNIHLHYNKWYNKSYNLDKISIEYSNYNILSLIQIYNDYFQHITFDTLTKIPFIIDLLKDESILILVMSNIQKQLLCNFGIDSDRIIIRQHCKSFCTKNAYYMNFINSDNKIVCMGSCGSNLLNNYLSSDNNCNYIVYLSRGNRCRSLFNDQKNQFIDGLKILARKYNKQFKLYTDPKNIDELKYVLSKSCLLISPHGGALGNIIWCNKQTNVIEFISYKKLKERPCFYYLSEACGIKYHYIEPISFNFDKRISIDVNLSINIIDKILSEN